MIKNIADLENKLQALLLAQQDSYRQGQVADYIPALADVDASLMGVAVATIDGNIVGAGDYQQAFSIQSISKVWLNHGNEPIR